MAKKPLRSQLNQVRAWVQQGRTDAWIAHQLEVSTAELREFRRRHELNAEEGTGEVDLRDEIEAEIEAALEEGDEEDDEPDDEEAEEGDEAAEDDAEDDAGESRRAPRRARAPRADADGDGDEGEDGAPKRRRRRRGGRGRGRARKALQATFDHGERDGYGLWLDPAVKDDPVYAEHWAGHRAVEVSVQPDQIVIKRSGDDAQSQD
jgi:hypothetical protein